MKYKKKISKWLLITHLVGLMLCVIIGLTIPFEDHLRWNLGYAIVWCTLFSVVALFFVLPIEFRFRKLIKIYSGTFTAGLFFVLLSTPLFPFFMEAYIPHGKYCENGEYLMRRGYQYFIDYPNSMLYKKQGIFERHICQYDLRPIKSFIIMEELGIIIINGYTINESCTDDVEITVILPFDYVKCVKHANEIKALGRKLNVKTDEFLYGEK